MRVKNILLTGDDGYNAIGTRLLVHFLKKDFHLTIAGTKDQQSGVGGMKNIVTRKSWGLNTIDGISALWVNGSPADAVECAYVHFPHHFDLVISGINLGANLGGCLISSGTFAAAFQSVNLEMAKHAIAISWDVSSHLHFKNHASEEDISSLHSYPGEIADKIIRKAIEKNCWDAPVVNINLPLKASEEIRFTKPILNIGSLWPPSVLDKKTHTLGYGRGNHATTIGDKDTDVQTLAKGNISVSLCQRTMCDTLLFEKVKQTTIRI